MIELVYGLPGDGKSLTGAGIVCHWLRTSKFNVCTNIPFKSAGHVAAYLDGKSPQAVDVGSRLRFLTDAEVIRFWRHLGPGLDFHETRPIKLPSATAEYRVIQVPDYDRLTNAWPGVLFVIDEAHIPFSAYNYADISDEMTWAVSQHRHLGIEVVLLSQHPEKIAKALRRDIHKFTRVRNFGNRRTFGFVMPGRFRRVTYPELPTRGAEQIVDEAGWFTLDKEIGNLYNTNAGTGISARTFGVERRASGLRLWNLAWIIPLIICLLGSIPYGMGWVMRLAARATMAFGHGFSQGIAAKAVPAAGASSGMSGVPTVGAKPPVSSMSTQSSVTITPHARNLDNEPSSDSPPPVHWVAQYWAQGRVQLALDDGRVLSFGQGWTGTRGNSQMVDGKWILPAVAKRETYSNYRVSN